MGRLFRQSHELCLIGINNNNIYKKLSNKSQRSVSFGENLKHSAKPEHLQDSLELMFPDKELNKIEIFARRQRPKWFCLGNESPMSYNEDIKISLNKLINLSENKFEDINNIIKQYKEQDKNILNKKWQEEVCV